MACDLHIHSTASDGGFDPVEMVEHASSIGLTCISLTDHDTMTGVSEARKRAEELDLPFISGIEITCVQDEQEIHLLGYFLDPGHPLILKHQKEARQFTIGRLTEIVEKLRRIGKMIEIERVIEIAGEGSLGRPHVARALVEGGYAATFQDAFDRYIGSEGPAFAPPKGKHPGEIYQLIEEAGGISSIAHPGLLGRAEMMDDNYIMEHREWGAKAIEVFHPRHDDYMVSYYMNLAHKFNMGITGGSDCHGPFYSDILMDRKFVPNWVAEKLEKLYRLQRCE